MSTGSTRGKPRLAIIPGDPSGIGPELVAKLLAEPDTAAKADVLLVGDRHVFEQGMRQAGVTVPLNPVGNDTAAWRDTPAFALRECETLRPEEVRVAEVTEAGGRSSLRTLDAALALAQDGTVDAVLFAPFNKAAMHAAGIGHEDEHRYIAARTGYDGPMSEFNVLDGLMTTRVTSHVALKDVPAMITEERIVRAVKLAHDTLRRAGHARPRIAVCALNPHAGDDGNFGREEIDVIRPAVDKARAMQIAADGPWPSDTVFLRARQGQADAVVTMYHDQGQIAMKLMGFDKGVTVVGGLPIPVATPAHGTAFDIAGTGVASVNATRAAFELLCRMASAPPGGWQAA